MWRLPDLFFRECHEKLTVMDFCSSRHFDLVSKIPQKVFKPEPCCFGLLIGIEEEIT